MSYPEIPPCPTPGCGLEADHDGRHHHPLAGAFDRAELGSGRRPSNRLETLDPLTAEPPKRWQLPDAFVAWLRAEGYTHTHVDDSTKLEPLVIGYSRGAVLPNNRTRVAPHAEVFAAYQQHEVTG